MNSMTEVKFPVRMALGLRMGQPSTKFSVQRVENLNFKPASVELTPSLAIALCDNFSKYREGHCLYFVTCT